MNPVEAFGHAVLRAMEYVPFVLLGLFLLVCAYCALLLRRMRGSTLEGGALFRHPHRPLEIRYPPWWTVQVFGDAVEFDSHEKHGVLVLTCRDAETCREDVRDLVRATLDAMRVALDDPEVRPLRVNQYAGAHASGFADKFTEARPPDAPPGSGDERRYAAAWAFRGPRTIAEFRYECGVLFGIVDGYYHDLMMATLRLDDDVDRPAEARPARDAAPADLVGAGPGV